MDAKVAKAFTCKLSGRVFLVGDTYAGEEERIAELARGGFVEEPARPRKAARKRAPARKG